ncbi:MAG: cation transporter, partial [Aeromonas veronii]
MTTHLQSPIHLQLPLSGMSCVNCAGRIATSLNKLDGVSATVNFALEQAAIELASPDRLPVVLDSIKSQGYDYGSETFLFQITCMTC